MYVTCKSYVKRTDYNTNRDQKKIRDQRGEQGAFFGGSGTDIFGKSFYGSTERGSGCICRGGREDWVIIEFNGV